MHATRHTRERGLGVDQGIAPECVGFQDVAANTTDNLSPQQEAAILALLSELSVAKAAEKCGVSERTIYLWLDQPAFEAAYTRARRQHFRQAIGISQRYTSTMLSVLVSIATDTKAPHSARVSAAAHVTKFSRESIELDDLAARMTALERAAASESGEAP